MKTTTIALSAMICFLARTESLSAQYSDTVVITDQVECNLPQIIYTNTILTPCTSPNGFGDLQVGDTVYIEYTPSNCATICMQGTTIDVTAFNLINSTAGINIIKTEERFNLYPQPTAGVFLIETPQIIELIELYSLQGQLVLIKTGNEKTIDITGFETGIYLLRITTEKGIYVTKTSKI